MINTCIQIICTLLSHIPPEDELDKKTTLREVKILKMLSHINIVNLIEAFKRRGRLYLVFEICDRNVLEILEENPQGLDPEQVRFYIWQLCRALEYCHRNGIIHRGLRILCIFKIITLFQTSNQKIFLFVQTES